MSRISSNRIIQILIKICSILTVMTAGCIGIVYFKAEASMLLIYCIFLLFWVLVPGAAALRNIGVKSTHASTTLIRSFFTGFALNILLYYLSILIGTDILLYVIGPLLSLSLAMQILKEKKENPLVIVSGLFSDTPASFFVFAACVFLCSIFTTQYTYISPEFSDFSFIKIDFSYHAGIVNALALDYPPKDPWIDGLVIQYHFFSEMLLSIPEKLFGLASEDMILSGTPYLITPVFSVALYSFFREFAARKERAGLYCLAFHFSNMFILKKFAYSWFMYHIYSNINNAGLGIACFLTALPMLKMWDNDSSEYADEYVLPRSADAVMDNTRTPYTPARNSKEMFLLALLIMLMTGIKGPVSLVLVGGIIGTLILGIILRQVNLKVVAMTVLSAISFVLIYVYVLGSQHENTTGGSIINPGEVTDIFFLKSEIMDALSGIPRIAGWAILFCVFIIFYLTAFLLPFIIGYIRELFLILSGRKKFCFSRITVYACCVVGFIGMMLLDFNGHSQVYFGFTASVLVPVIAFWLFEDLQDSRTTGVRLLRCVFTICICLFACTSLLYMYSSAESAHTYYLTHNKSRNTYRNVSTSEYEGLIWLRDNTDDDSLIASDRYNSVPLEEYDYTARGSNTHFAYAVYSQRRQYIEGAGFSVSGRGTQKRHTMIMKNKQLYDPDNEDRGALARELDVDYVVVSKRFDNVGDLSNEDYELVFSNDEMDIYEIEEAG